MSAPIRTFWWRWKHPHRLNFGDELTAPLVERITGRRVVWAGADSCELVGAGSVIQIVLDQGRGNRPRMWGSGFMRAGQEGADRAALDALAVRGRRTLARVDGVTEREIALGDPGLLAPLLLEGTVRTRYALGVIPHYRDASAPFVATMRALGTDVRIIDVGWTPSEVAREIASCEAVLSSSLHGLIFSDALGVPNAHVRLGGRIGGGLYKFRDYYSAFSGASRYREVEVPAGGTPVHLDDVLESVHSRYVRPQDLERLQNGLISALERF
ncbi:polysaccharide pyruvyl transferase family protein [Brachybacterium sp. AOP43-C2-M15]|uniref:polysaccharide pyruvyl transferase family protein n=1 Tax=Brachybacterium sp. AOP43-C2-M15 TaxID=3457661 RepID=UPI0040331C85